jgi:hypothetical protein
MIGHFASFIKVISLEPETMSNTFGTCDLLSLWEDKKQTQSPL